MGLMRKNTLPPPWTPNGYIGTYFRNLPKKELGAVIFGCKHHTITECFLKQLFGLPASHFSYVKNIAPGHTLFLFNYSDRTLHGIFEAATPGLMNINPFAWITSEGTVNTPFAAQVRVHFKECRKLHEEEFQHIIADNYYDDKHFWFELDKGQTSRLTNLFLSSPLPAKIPRPPNIPSWYRRFDTARSESCKAIEHTNINISATEKKWSDLFNISAPEKKWSDFFRTSDQASSPQETVKPLPQKKWSDLFKTSDHASSPQETVKSFQQSCSDAVTTEYDSAVPDSWEELAHSDMDETDEDEVTCMQDRERDNDDPSFTDGPSSEDEIFWDSVTVAKEVGRNLASSKHWERRNDLPKLIYGGLMKNSSSTVEKLIEEFEKLKVSQLKQVLRIDFLEHELALAKLEIDHLKKLSKLESIPPYSVDHCDDEGKSPCLKTEEFVLIVGGFDGSAWVLSLDSYSPSEDNVTSLCPMTFLRSYASVAMSKEELYLLGGLNDGVWCNTVEFYNLVSNQWVQCAPLNQEKGKMAGASLNDNIYAIGGGNGVDCFAEVELFDINSGKWISTQSMMEKRLSPAATDMNGALYVAGGYDGKNYLRSAERFDPRESSWTSLSNMNTIRARHSVVAFNEKIYALGGYNGSTMVSTVEVFDPRVGLWTMKEPMSVSRGNFGSFVSEGKIYAIGGIDDNKTFDVVECYEEDYGWHMVGPSAIGKRCHFSVLKF